MKSSERQWPAQQAPDDFIKIQVRIGNHKTSNVGAEFSLEPIQQRRLTGSRVTGTED